MQIIIPMTGIGKRFLDAWYTTPKPLIEVEWKPIIEYVVNLFPGETDFLFVVNEDHAKETNLLQVLKRIAPYAQVVMAPKEKWPVSSALRAEHLIKDDEHCIVCYCDFNMIRDYEAFKKRVVAGEYDGAVPSYIGFHPHLLHTEKKYASMRVDKDNLMLEIKEKHSFTENLMESYQSAGMYHFKSWAILKEYFKKLMDSGQHINGEYYASVPYQLMAGNGLSIYVHEVEKFCQRWTPEDLQEYEARSKKVKDPAYEDKDRESDNDAKTYQYRKEYFAHPHTKKLLKGIDKQ